MMRIKNIDLTYPEVWRVFISGSSSSGKTYFARQLLEAKLFKQSNIIYCHPDIEEDFPTDWNDHFPNVIFECGLPNLADMLALPPYSVIVLDDLFDEAAKSKEMSYLFRVLSSKKKLHVIIMTQRYYEGGSPGLTLRNSSTHHILMNNSDARTNVRVACSMGLKREVVKANEMNKSKLYPYIAIDRTNHARITDTQVYTDILSPVKEIVIGCQAMNIHYKDDFDKKYEIKNGFAVKRAYEIDSDDESYYPSDSESDFSDYQDVFDSQETRSSTSYASSNAESDVSSVGSSDTKSEANSSQSVSEYESQASSSQSGSEADTVSEANSSQSVSEYGSDDSSQGESKDSSQSEYGSEDSSQSESEDSTQSESEYGSEDSSQSESEDSSQGQSEDSSQTDSEDSSQSVSEDGSSQISETSSEESIGPQYGNGRKRQHDHSDYQAKRKRF